MKKLSGIVSVFSAVTLLSLGAANGLAANRVESPNEKVAVEFSLQTGGVPAYKIEYLDKPIVLESELGLEPQFTNGFHIVSASTSAHTGSWTNRFGERRIVPDNYHELDVDLQNKSRQRMHVTFRAYDEGAAFRYSFPAPARTEFHFDGEWTEFRFPQGTFGYEEHGTEGRYHYVPVADIQPQCERPLTLAFTNGLFASLTEADNQDYPRMLLSPLPGVPGALVSALGGTTSNTTGPQFRQPDDPNAILRGGDSTPWRVLVLGQTPGELLDRNYLILDLNPPCTIRDTFWIKPGKAMRDTKLTTTNSKAIIDFASKAGLSYVVLDSGWYGSENFWSGDATTVRASNLNLPEVIHYGQQKGVGVILYVDYRQMRKQRDILFPLYEKWGIKGVKIGFVAVGSQAATTWVTQTIRLAAKYHLLLDTHDGYRPTGLCRTWPNLLTVEGVRGNEHMPTPEHNCTLPFTRYVAGPADYTVCYYTPRKKTNFAHQLAMSVVAFSPLQFIFWYDKPSDYHGEPEIQFFRKVPTVWDDTKVVNGEIGKFATIARRCGNDWFVGTINDSTPRTLKVPLAFLDKGRSYQAHIYSENPSVPTRTHVAVTTLRVNAETTLEVPLEAGGGQAMWIEALPKG
ncbi:MAG TPA: glycoside hydrolase family 97 catalytic domain-containing protein [Verrucomicrobiae bacterium]|nr:glycoside hydrolase family 97 catalytic domain-containing protein [Verrucomicrobiae bacterium]